MASTPTGPSVAAPPYRMKFSSAGLFDRVCGPILLHRDAAETVSGFDIPEPHRFPVLADRIIDPAPRLVGDAEIVVCARIPRSHADRLSVLAHRVIDLALQFVSKPNLEMRPPLLRALGDDIAPKNEVVLPYEVPHVCSGSERPSRDQQRQACLKRERDSEAQALDRPEQRGAGGDGGARAGEIHSMLDDDVADRDDSRLGRQGDEEA